MSALLLPPFRRLAMWAVWNVPLGRLAPHVFGFAIGAKPHKIEED